MKQMPYPKLVTELSEAISALEVARFAADAGHLGRATEEIARATEAIVRCVALPEMVALRAHVAAALAAKGDG